MHLGWGAHRTGSFGGQKTYPGPWILFDELQGLTLSGLEARIFTH